jgi:hypothetical protein
MSPFRDTPSVELGPLDVGLGPAATRAMVALPRGGRLVSLRIAPVAAHIAGTLGSVGLFGVVTFAFLVRSVGWSPESLSDVALCVAVVAAGGLSLAAIFRTMDRTARQLTQPAVIVARGTRRVLRKLASLSRCAERAAEHFDARHVAALSSALAAAAEPEIARWIPADVRGRGELLLARAETRLGGPGWTRDDARRERVRELLLAAASRLADPQPAEADLAALDQAPAALRAPPPRRICVSVAVEPARTVNRASPSEEPPDEEPVPTPPRPVLSVRR